MEEIGKVLQECSHVFERIMKESMEVVRLFPQECLQERVEHPCQWMVEQSVDNYVLERVEEIVEVNFFESLVVAPKFMQRSNLLTLFLFKFPTRKFVRLGW